MENSEFSTLSVDALFKKTETSRSGLSDEKIQQRQQKNGLNVLEKTQNYWWHILIRQFASPFVYLLVCAAILSLGLGERIDGLMILMFVGINTLLGFYQEYRSEQALKLLKKYIISKTNVIRNGELIEIDSNQLVVGDIVILEPGDLIPADLRLIEDENLTIDESVLTGESAPVNKTSFPITHSPKQLFESKNLCFSATSVVSGKAKGVVIGIGKQSAIGQITKLTTETHHQSSFEKGINRFSTFILYLIVLTLIGIFVVNVIIKGPSVNIPTLLIFSIALAVSVIPEALPVVITFSLSAGALKLAKHKVIVKRLSAVEDLGNIEVLCTDKTGTLTENVLTVSNTYFHLPQSPVAYAYTAVSQSTHQNHSVHSFDSALEDALSPADKKALGTYELIRENPFDPDRKRSSMVIKIHNSYELVVRGAFEEIAKLSKNITLSDRKKIETWAKSERGKRIIAVARKNLKSNTKEIVQEENDLELVGLISFVDPIKSTTVKAVEKAKKLGLKIKILTGDSPEVSGAVAAEIGLIENAKDVLTGEEFIKLSTSKQHEAINAYTVFARVSPQQKYLIIKLLQEHYEVGYLGEGINDAPALKIANVSLVVQEATDVARETADIILLKKSLGVIIDGIHEGRVIFTNTSKYIKATLASNFGNFYTVSIASLFISFLPLLPLQILLINLLTDFPMVAIAADTVDPQELRTPRSYSVKELALASTLLGIVSSVFDFLFFLLFFKISPQVLQTNWFVGSVITELLFLFSVRTKLPIWKARFPAKSLVFFSAIAFCIGVIFPFTTLGATFFTFTPPTIAMLAIIFSIAAIYFITTETVKILYYKLF